MSPKLTHRLIIGLVFFILIIFSDRWIFGGAIEGKFGLATRIVTRPVVSASLAFRRFIASNFETDRLLSENENLRRELNARISDSAKLEILNRENEILRKQLGIVTSGKLELLETRVTGILRNGIVSEVVINSGESSGVKKGMAVLGGGSVAGLVIETSDQWSRVMLLDDQRSAASIRFVGNNTLAIAKGRSNGNLSVELVGIQEKVSKDVQMVTSGYDEFPEGLVVGTVDTVGISGSNLFQAITARTAFDILASPYLYVMTR